MVHLNSFVGHFTHICGAGVNTDTTHDSSDWGQEGTNKVRLGGQRTSLQLQLSETRWLVSCYETCCHIRDEGEAVVVHSTVASPHGRHASDV